MEGAEPDFVAVAVTIPLIIPFAIGLLILAKYRQDKVGQLITAFTFKPLLAYPLWFWLMIALTNHFNNPLIAAALPLFPGVVMTLCIFIFYITVFKAEKISWLFLSLDILYLMSLFLFLLFEGNRSTPFGFVGIIFPSLCAIIALVVIRMRTKELLQNPQ